MRTEINILTLAFCRYEDDVITNEQVQRVLAPVLQMIRDGVFDCKRKGKAYRLQRQQSQQGRYGQQKGYEERYTQKNYEQEYCEQEHYAQEGYEAYCEQGHYAQKHYEQAHHEQERYQQERYGHYKSYWQGLWPRKPLERGPLEQGLQQELSMWNLPHKRWQVWLPAKKHWGA